VYAYFIGTYPSGIDGVVVFLLLSEPQLLRLLVNNIENNQVFVIRLKITVCNFTIGMLWYNIQNKKK